MAKRVGGDKWMFFTTVLLVVVGLAMVFSASAVVAQERYHSPYTFVGKQALWALAGLAAMLLLSRIDYTLYKSPRFIYPALSVTTFCWCWSFLSRLAQHPPLDSLRRLLHLPAVGDRQARAGPLPGLVSLHPARQNAATGDTLAARHPHSAGFYRSDRLPARPGHRAGSGRRHRHDAVSGRHGLEVPGRRRRRHAARSGLRCFSGFPGASSASRSSTFFCIQSAISRISRRRGPPATTPASR